MQVKLLHNIREGANRWGNIFGDRGNPWGECRARMPKWPIQAIQGYIPRGGYTGGLSLDIYSVYALGISSDMDTNVT